MRPKARFPWGTLPLAECSLVTDLIDSNGRRARRNRQISQDGAVYKFRWLGRLGDRDVKLSGFLHPVRSPSRVADAGR